VARPYLQELFDPRVEDQRAGKFGGTVLITYAGWELAGKGQ